MSPTTKQFRKRNAILSYLRSTDVHPSADMVFAELKAEIPDLSLATVYRNLAMFKNQGEIISVGTVNGVERFDGITAPHVHFVCTDCSAVIDLHTLPVPEELTSAATAATGGSINTCQHTFIGSCGDCLKKSLQGGETA